MHSSLRLLLPVLFLTVAACDDGVGPEPNPQPDPIEGGVDVAFDASYERTDSSIVVNGETLFDFPDIDRALRLERYHRFLFGGVTHANATRYSETWRLMLIHQHSEVARNDSTILGYVDHGDVAIEGAQMEKLTDEPGVMPGDPLGFDSFFMYLQTSYGRVVWLGGEETMHGDEGYHGDLAAGAEIDIATTGSAGVPSASGSFRAASVAELVAVENGDPLDLDVDSPPTLDTAEALVLEFDDPLDPTRGFIYVYPMPPAPSGARAAFMQPQAAAHRIVIPASVLATLVADAGEAPVAYRVTVHEYATDQSALAGTAYGEAFSLPLFQISATTLEVFIQP